MVKAMAPKAPIGAARMMKPTMPKSACAGLVDDAEQQLAALAELCSAEREQDREEQHLQDLALGERADEGVGDDVHQEVRRVLCSLDLVT